MRRVCRTNVCQVKGQWTPCLVLQQLLSFPSSLNVSANIPVPSLFLGSFRGRSADFLWMLMLGEDWRGFAKATATAAAVAAAALIST